MMKRFNFLIPIVILLITLVWLTSPTFAYAEDCTGNSGKAGACKVPMDCPSNKIDGQGSCLDENFICCLKDNPPGDGGTGDCSDVCTTSADCLDAPNFLDCTKKVCTNNSICAPCKGTSGYAGSCTTPSVCAGKGKNSGDGTGSCTGGSICCTNAPPSETCKIEAEPPFLVGAYFYLDLDSSEINTPYTFTAPGCTGSCLASVKTDSNGHIRCSLDCGPPAGKYNIVAKHGAVECSQKIDVLNEAGPPCIGNSGVRGNCVAIMCPGGTIPDGVGNCTGGAYIGCCISVNSEIIRCGKNDNGINTAIGCIPVDDTDEFLGWILSWAIGIGGGIAFLLIVYASFMIMTSQGNPERLKAGQELLTSAISGLILLIFSVFILKFIGLDILKLGDFGFGK